MSLPGPIGVLASRVRLDEKRIAAALDRRGVPYEFLDSRTYWRELGAGRPAWSAVLNREIGQTRAGYAARLLETAGVPVVNDAASTELCGDKWRTSEALCRAGLPTPRTALALTPEAALDAAAALGYPVVIKPLVGSWGRLVTALPDATAAEAVLEYVAALPHPQSHVVYVQELVTTPRRDIRAIVVGAELVGAVYRLAAGWRTNVARGAVTEPCQDTPELHDLAVAAAAAVGASIAGVDVLEHPDGRLLALEVNSGVEFSGFQQAMGDRADVAGRIVDHVLAVAS